MNKDLKITKTLKTILTTKKLGEEKKIITSLPGLSMGMGFPWDSHGNHPMGWDGMGQHTLEIPMGWDGTAHICICHGRVAMS